MIDAEIRVVALFGPTAVGKSHLAMELSLATGGEIVSADSMQLYRGLSVLTDQPSAQMLSLVPHHMISVAPLTQEYSAARFADEAAAVIRAVAGRGKLAILAGGTGLYVRALLGGMQFAGRVSNAARGKWGKFLREKGEAAALLELEKLDPAAAAIVDPHNPRRLVRALAAAESDGPSVAAERDRLWSAASPFKVISFGLEIPREDLYARIDARVDAMLAGGAVDEVRRALEGQVSRSAAQAIGFAEIKDYLAGTISLEEAAAAIRQKSRRYAKRQLTWMRKMPDIVRIDLASAGSSAAARIINHLDLAGFIS